MIGWESISFAYKHFKAPYKIAILLLFNRPVKIGVKSGQLLLRDRLNFWALRSTVNNGWKIVKAHDDIVYLRKKDVTIACHPIQSGILREPIEKYYKVFDYKNKVVLDVGGYAGYSSVLFSMWGADKIIVYEPLKENCDVIKINFKIAKVNGEIHCTAIANSDSYITLPYNIFGSRSFGLEGNKRYKVRAVSLTKVLTREKIDIAKFDCEGCEYALLSVPSNVIRAIPRYIVEYHRGCQKLINMFENLGFSCKILIKKDENIGIFKAIK